jgi:hypothetical protein
MNERYCTWLETFAMLGNIDDKQKTETTFLPLLADGAPPNTHASTEKRTTKRKNMIVDDKSL